VREEPGQNPDFHAPPGGTKVVARRPINSEEKFVLCGFPLWEWFNWEPVESFVVCDKLCFRVYVI